MNANSSIEAIIKDPRRYHRLEDLIWLSRIISQQLIQGKHGGLRKEGGMEFSQFRSYSPGDDLRLLDWKQLAKTDRYYVRESDKESPVQIEIILDWTGSMAHSWEGLAKDRFALLLVSVMGHVFLQQGDPFRIHYVHEGQIYLGSTIAQPEKLRVFLQSMLNKAPKGKWPNPRHLFSSVPAKIRSQWIWISDLHQQGHEIMESLSLMKGIHMDHQIFRLLAENEYYGFKKGRWHLKDLESEEMILVDSQKDQEAVMEKWEMEELTWQNKLKMLGFSYERLLCGRNFVPSLRNLIRRRKQLL